MSKDPSGKVTAASSPPGHAAPCALVIDDDPDMRESLTMVLEDHGFCVVTAVDGLEGLRVFREEAPAVVVTDIRMPGLNGIGTIVQMRRDRPSVKIFALSGGGRIGRSDFLTIARDLGADAVFEKGPGTRALIEALGKLRSEAV